MASHAQMVEQFRAGKYVDTRGDVGFVALKHVQALGHIEVEQGQHVAYVVTVRIHPLRIPPFATAQAADDFIQQCRAACPLGKVFA
ncbi:hypothetical protein [Deinococcus multiflagellatus]|uniref:hypothetical protein n=1 Tax=Deinococcus multiflagellatus TaxID=1656887 RepID=UPI001CCBD478|nr:hypothetical protein [Deinococcus multiflagellatus]MBZ9712212.1 hypothetical protein [Deinococcus multiflagellatus]